MIENNTWMAFSFLEFIMLGMMVFVLDYRCRQVNELRDENKELRKFRKTLK